MFRPRRRDLVDRAGDFVAAQRRDDPLDLPPVAEARDIAVIAAALGADRRLEPGVIAVTFDQLGRVGQCNPATDEGTLHAASHNTPAFPDCGRSSSIGRKPRWT